MSTDKEFRVDERLPASAQRVQEALAAAGTPHSIFPTTFKELLSLTGGTAMPVADDEARD